jgi:ElaB/YqjD/DUF883 family membrane-anchored ribosome-binding protein
MAERADDLQQNIEETRQDMEETRASMTEKLELLEERVRETLEDTKSAVDNIVENVKETVGETVGVVKETVEGAKSTVEDIVENVKGTMDETVTTVKQAFDLSYQVEQHPWLMVGGAVLLGKLLGGFLRREPRTNGHSYDEEENGKSAYAAALSGNVGIYAKDDGKSYSESPERSRFAQAPEKSRWWSELGQFQEEVNVVKGAVIGTVMGTMRELIRQSMPNVAPTLEKVLNSASRKLGVEPSEPSAESQKKGSEDQGQHSSQSVPAS